MLQIKKLNIIGYEKVIEATNSDVGLHAFVAIHNCSLGPALGGLRIYPYKTSEEALNDALRLAKAMTFKSAIAECGLGGGKSVIMANPDTAKTKKFLTEFAKVMNSLEGEYIVAEDVGSTVEDMSIIHKTTPYVAALPLETSSGDPSRFTAWGVFRGMQAVAKYLWRSPDLKGKSVLIQGLGSVGYKLANLLFWEGANLYFNEVNEERLKEVMKEFGGEAVPPELIYSTKCDIFAPCAMGGVINEGSISDLQCQAIAGSANNQLSNRLLGETLREMEILYAPDFIINAGGIINASTEFEVTGYHPEIARNKVDHIYDILQEVFLRAKKEKKSTNEIAREIAHYNLKNGIAQRTEPIVFS